MARTREPSGGMRKSGVGFLTAAPVLSEVVGRKLVHPFGAENRLRARRRTRSVFARKAGRRLGGDGLETQSRKLLDAYYAGALDVTMLREEQDRLRRERDNINERMRAVDATLAQWQEVFGTAVRFATMCGTAYRKAPEGARKLYNRALFDRVLVVGGRIAEPVYAEPFPLVFGVGGFEYESLERETRLELATPTLAR
jgi:hypothetical protein